MRCRKRDKFPWNNPVQVTVLHGLIELIVSQIEGLYIKPAQLDAIFQASEAIQNLGKNYFISFIDFYCFTVHL